MARQTRRDLLKALGLAAAAAAVPRTLWAKQEKPKPNIVLIMVDDMGFSDIGCYGGEIRTPNLDKLAAGGLRFTQFYNTARCCPTRASLMTGLYMHQAGVGHMMGDYGVAGYRGDLSRTCVTIPEVLRPAGYGTYMSGKWHVTRHTGADGPKHNWPCQRGYDRYFGTITGAGSFYTPSTLTRDNERIEAPKSGFYYTHAISDHAVKCIVDHHKARPSDPLFCYVAYTAPHWPLHALADDIARYRGRYRKGWDALRAERHARMIEMGIVRKAWALTPRDRGVTAWRDVDDARKDTLDLKMAIYAAQIDAADQGIGRIVAALEKTGRLDNTLIFFLADNGGCAEGGPWGFDRKRKGKMVLGEDSSFSSYGLSWANASNTPFRRYKHWVHEGGISTPLIVHWPARVKARGELRRQPGHLIDIMATCVAASGAAYPAEHKGGKITPREGKSLLGAFDNKPIEREAIYWEHEGNRAVRKGKWKLVSQYPGPWELYDLEADRTELNGLAGKHPEIVKALSALYDAWARRCNVVPWGELRRGRRKPARNVGSKKLSFDLKSGDDLPREQAPMIAGRSVTITATFRADKPDGVIVAQGGSALGYALYLRGGKLTMATRAEGKLTVVAAADKLPAGRVSVSARLAKDGAITLEIGGRKVASGKAPGPVDSQPIDGLQVGRDDKGAVGDYDAPNAFSGRIEKLHIELGN